MASRGLAALNKMLEGKDTTYLGRRTDSFEMAMTSRLRMDRPPVVVYPRAETLWAPDSSIETDETASVTSSTEGDQEFPEEYRITGLVWYVPGLTNTCNTDSFLSAWVRRVLQTHGRAAKDVVCTDLVGNALIAIADKAQMAYGRLDAKEIKLIWYKAVLSATGEDPVLENVEQMTIDLIGINLCSIFQHLRNHSSYATETRCDCGTVYNRDFFLEIPNMTELTYLSEKKEYHKARSPRCLGCGQKRVLVDLVSDPQNWILPILWNGTGDNRNPSLRTIPRYITFGKINYKIGYVSYTQTSSGLPSVARIMAHEVSIQDIRGKWYLYDGLLDPKFHRFDQEKYTTNNPRMSSLVYFKQDEVDKD